jgi:hypothetical protein
MRHTGADCPPPRRAFRMISGVRAPTELFLDFDPILPWWPVVEEPQRPTIGDNLSSPSQSETAGRGSPLSPRNAGDP